MSIAITDEHQELGSTVRSFLQAHGALAANRSLLEADDEPRPTFWGEMADLGWLGIHLPEAYGGAGAALSELIVVLEEFGRQVAPGPFLPTVVASALLAQCATPDLQSALLPGLADGSVTGALGLGGSLTLSDGLLDGPAGIVLGGASADLLLLRLGEDVVVVRPGLRRRDRQDEQGPRSVPPFSRRDPVVGTGGGRRRHRPGRPARPGAGRAPWALRRPSASRRPAPTRPWPTPRCACSSVGPSAPFKP